ncbi:MAG: hypothetical protein FWB86_11690 [Treponema sp.]|nr:hypothetical protein [Treponema sp.]
MGKSNEERSVIWHKYFVKYFIIGLFLILFFVIYDSEIKILINGYPFWQKLLNIIFSMIGILGPSLVVASLFTFSIESKNFINYIKDKIEKTMIKKEFLDKLNEVDKREALRRILSPSNEKYEMFSNIKNYFEETITKSMTLFEYSFKSHFTIDINAFYKNNRVCFEETMSYRIYKSKNGFEQIRIGFTESEFDFEPKPEMISFQYIPQNCKYENVEISDLKLIKGEEESGFKWVMYSYDIPKEIDAEFISINIKFNEYGSDHWQLFGYKTILPSEGIKVKMNCDEGLVIKEHVIFDNENNYVKYISEDKKKIEIATSQWISSGNGVAVLVGKKL